MTSPTEKCLRILTIDDEEAIRSSFRHYLEDCGYDVLEAADGRIGLDVFRAESPDLVLVDLRMPEVDGLDVLGFIRENSPDTPVIVISGTGVIGDAVEALHAGAWDYLLKPVLDLSVLLHALEKALERARLLRENRAYRERLESEIVRRTAELKQTNIELKQINTRLRQIVETTKSLSTCSRTGEFELRLLEEFGRHMQANGGSFYLKEEAGLRLVHSLDPGHAVEFIPFPLSEGSLLQQALQERKPLLIRYAEEMREYVSSGWAGYGSGYALIFPLLREEGRTMGVLSLHSKAMPPFTEQDLEVGQILASYSCEALDAARSAAALRSSEEKYRAIFENLQDVYYELRPDGTIIELSPSIRSVLQYEREEALHTRASAYYADRQDPQTLFRVLEIENRVSDFEVDLVAKDGKRVPCAISAQVLRDKDGAPIQVCGTFRSIAQRKKAEEALAVRLRYEEGLARCSQALLESGGDALSASLNDLLDATRVSRVSIFENIEDPKKGLSMRQSHEACAEGARPQISNPALQCVPYLSDFKRWLEALSADRPIAGFVRDFPKEERALLQAQDIQSLLALPIQVGGEYHGFILFEDTLHAKIWEEEDVRLLRTSAEMIGAYLSRKRTEENLLNMAKGVSTSTGESFFRDLVYHLARTLGAHCAFVGELVAKDRIDTIAMCVENRIVENIAFDPASTPLGRMLQGEKCMYREAVREAFPRDPMLREMGVEGYAGVRLLDSSGLTLGVMVVMYRQPIKQTETAESMLDIFASRASAELDRARSEKERDTLESRLRQAQKMEAIGTLAGGIAHDFNNILQAICGFTDLAQNYVEEDSTVSNCLDQVAAAGKRASELVRQILTFSRQGEHELKPLSLESIVREALTLLRGSLPSTIEIREEISNCRPILADPTQIHQVVMNLSTNAYHAMREAGGVLTIRLAEKELNASNIGPYHGIAAGRYVCLEVADTGHGMDRETIERIFEPFFTTKGTGEGTGMGLATTHGIVQGHEGAIAVESEPGVGSTFSIVFPVCLPPRTDRRESPAPKPAPLSGTERILFVDDEVSNVKLWSATLERLGYAVVSFTNSLEALAAYQREPHRFDLVITDMTMPNLTGLDLSIALLERRADLPIILCSGFNETASESRAKQIGIREYVLKPLTVYDLSAAIRRALEPS